MDRYEYIVAGAGSAGCVVATRLVQAGHSVLLVEAGPADNHPFIHIPGTFAKVHGGPRTVVYHTMPELDLNGRSLAIPQGRTLGGGSSVNAMIYIRGQAQDYDEWASFGCNGWDWATVLPYFRRAETNERLSAPLHGSDGPLKVSDPRHRHPLSLAFVRAAQECGLAYSHDFNGTVQQGVGFFQTTTWDGRRASTAATYLASVRGNPRIRIITKARVLNVTVKNDTASGVRIQHEDGTIQAVEATREVILCAGALATPKVLMHSGIGPARHLSQMGIAVVRDLPDVGENFQDHLTVPIYGRTREPVSLYGEDRGLRAVRHGLAYLTSRSGLLTTNVAESGAFIDTTGGDRPDVQIHMMPTLVGDIGRTPPAGHGISISPCGLRPKSRGTVRLSGADPHDPVELSARYLSAAEDLDTLISGIRWARRILRAPALAAVVSKEILPAGEEDVDDVVLADHVRAVAKTVYHPCGTCRMGSDERAVVDPLLRVKGIARLRVADASVFPAIPSGNTNAPTIMVGERCAAFITGESGKSAP